FFCLCLVVLATNCSGARTRHGVRQTTADAIASGVTEANACKHHEPTCGDGTCKVRDDNLRVATLSLARLHAVYFAARRSDQENKWKE
ncbi:hypothetical protein, partial [Burkholderia cepacia]|uniref:hypothetical protein n=1 Tax=Burkholderia cepacia TaxID=292 RepID=UPI001CF0FD51